MDSITSKSEYVRKQAKHGSVGHHCHWPGCDKEVPPAMWGCKSHWFKLPKAIRDRIFGAYRPGQEISKEPTGEYLDAVKAAREWILATYME